MFLNASRKTIEAKRQK